jgi:hypothetical protein
VYFDDADGYDRAIGASKVRRFKIRLFQINKASWL